MDSETRIESTLASEWLGTPLHPGAMPGASSDPDVELLPAWEQVAEGRFRPRRIRGSYLGRELG